MSRKKKPFKRRLGKITLLIVLLTVGLPLALIAFALDFLYRVALYLLVWTLWLPKGKDTLFVYSDSPIWHDYMAMQVLPLVKDRAVVLNWSERNEWPRWSLAVAVFHHFGSARDFNPLVLLFQPLHLAKVFRFWSAFFIVCKRGYKEPLERLRQELIDML
jgi:hypothetical protein